MKLSPNKAMHLTVAFDPRRCSPQRYPLETHAVLLKVDLESRLAVRVPSKRLNDFDLKEQDLQDILFLSLDRLIPDDELLVIMQSRKWQEEPDLMALDKDGKLYIFELKAWESHSENILQALRYGQLFRGSSYDALNELFGKFDRSGVSLKDVHRGRFEVALDEGEFNRAQVFVVMTNGLDYRTREAIQYSRAQKQDVRPWVYRVYKSTAGEMLLEVSPFAVQDNPYEDVAEGYYILNTNYGNHPQDHDVMINNGKAAAYFSPWKYKIERLSRGDVIFLYQTGVGIVAMGVASGKNRETCLPWGPAVPR